MSLFYNGIEFSHILTQDHSMRPGKDPSGTDQTGTHIRIAVRSLITPSLVPGSSDDASPEATLVRIRHYLTQPRGVMYYDTTSPAGVRGANPIINLTEGRDDGTGPWPDDSGFRVTYTTAGLFEVEWACTVFIRDCGFPFPLEPLSLRWEDSISLDESWKTTWHRSGTCIISSQSAETIEWFRRNKLAPQIPAGFKRVRAEYRMSRDGLRCDFSFTDEQIRFAPLYPAVKMTITQSETTPLPNGMKRGQVNVTMVGIQNANVVDLVNICRYVMLSRALAANPIGSEQGFMMGESILQTEEDEHSVRVSASANYKIQPDGKRNTVLQGNTKNWGGSEQVLSGRNNVGGTNGVPNGATLGGAVQGFSQNGVSGLLGALGGGGGGGGIGSGLISGFTGGQSTPPPQVQQQRSQTAFGLYTGKTGNLSGFSPGGIGGAVSVLTHPFFNPTAPSSPTSGDDSNPYDGSGQGVQGNQAAFDAAIANIDAMLGSGGSTGSTAGATTRTQQQRSTIGLSAARWVGWGTSPQSVNNPGGYAQWANPNGSIGGPEGGVGLATAVRFFAALLNDPCGDQLVSNTDAGSPVRELRTTVPAGYNTAALGGKGAPSPTDTAQLVVAMSSLSMEQYSSTVQSTDDQGLNTWDGQPGVYDYWQTSNEYKDDPGVLVLPTSDPAGTNIKVNYSSAMYTLIRRWAAKRSGAPPALPPKTVSKASGDVDTNWIYVGGDGPHITNNKVAADSASIVYEAKGVYIFQALDASTVTHLADIPPFYDSAPMKNSKSWVQNALDGVLDAVGGGAVLNPVGVDTAAAGAAGFFAGLGSGFLGGGGNGTPGPWGSGDLYFPTY